MTLNYLPNYNSFINIYMLGLTLYFINIKNYGQLS